MASSFTELDPIIIEAIDRVSPVFDKIPEKARDTKKKLAKETIIQYHSDIANLKEEIDKVRKAIRKEKDPEIRINLRMREQALSQAKTELNRQLNNYVNTGDIHISRLQAKFNSIKTGLVAVVDWMKWAAVWAIWVAWKAIVNLADNYEKAKISFTTMLWSAEKAEAKLQELSDFAKKTPFELGSVRENAKQLLAMGISADNLVPTMKALWDVSAGLSVPMERLALNYGQVISKGKLTGQELKDFTTAGVPLLDELSKNLGKSKTEIQSMVSKGQISAEMVTEAFRTMTSEWGRFADLMSKQSQTLSGMRSNLSDSLAQIGEKIWLFLLPWLKESVDWLWKLFDRPDNKMEEEIKRLDDANREMQKVVNEARNELNDLNEDLKNGKISSSEYNVEFERLSGIIATAEQDIAKTNAKIAEQNALLSISTGIAWNHSATLWELEGKQNAIQAQLQALSEKYNNNQITEQAYLEQKKLLITEYQNLEQKINEENEAHARESTVYRMLQESGMKAADIKSTLANLKIENGQDINNLTAEQKAANATAISYLAMAKAKAQASVLEAKTKLENQQKSDASLWWYIKRGGYNADLYAETNLQKKLKAELKIQEEYLAGIEKIEKDQNAFMTNISNPTSSSVDATTSSNSWWSWGARKDREKEKIEQLKKTLKEQRDIEAKGIQESLFDEETKQKKLSDLKEKYDERIKQIDWKTVDEMLQNAQDYNKKIKDNKDKSLKEDQKVVEKMIKIFRDGWEKIKKDATQALKEIEREKASLSKEHKNDLASRYADIQKNIKDMEREYAWIEGISNNYNIKELENLYTSKDAKIGDIDIDKAIEYMRHVEELKLLNENLTEEERNKAIELSKQTETQKLINKYKEEELNLNERAKILNAIKSSKKDENGFWDLSIRYDEDAEKYYYSDIEGKEIEVTDIKNQQLIQQYLDKEVALNNQAQQELEAWQKRIDGEKDTAKEIAKIHKTSTQNYQEELNRRQNIVKAYVENVKAMMAEISAAKSTSSASVTNNNQVTNSNNRITNYHITNVGSTSRSFPGGYLN